MNKIILILLLAFSSSKNLRELLEFNFESFYSELLAKHNEVRKKHNAASLTKSEDLEKIAKAASEEYAKAGKLSLKRDYYKNELLGENNYVYGANFLIPNVDDIFSVWYYREETFYDYEEGKPKYALSVEHFTQIVWKSTKQIGCAYTLDKWDKYKYGYYIVCKYYPAGNISGREKYNVDKPSS